MALLGWHTTAMSEHDRPADAVDHRRLAVDLFNSVWKLIDKSDRTPAEDLAMIHAAHASRHHWGIAGVAKNWCIGEWQIARVYATLGRAEPSRFHAAQALRLAEANDLGPFLLASAHEGIARAVMVAGDVAEFDRHIAESRRLGAQITDEEDREIWKADLESLRRPEPD